ncbi:MAG: DUF1850 domain-containing protein [Saccharospirillum sp.]
MIRPGARRCIAGLWGLWIWVAAPAVAQTLHLQVESLTTGRLVVERLVLHSPQWCLHWQHSVQGFLVKDCFDWCAGRLLLSHSHQPDFAAGLDHIPGRGTLLSDGAGGYIIDNIDEPLNNNELILRVGSPRVDHRVVHHGEVTSLSDLAAGELVRIRVQEAPE